MAKGGGGKGDSGDSNSSRTLALPRRPRPMVRCAGGHLPESSERLPFHGRQIRSAWLQAVALAEMGRWGCRGRGVCVGWGIQDKRGEGAICQAWMGVPV